jgi:nitroreductase
LEFFDVVARQRACRAFAPDDVDDAAVEQILRAATHAPSAENRQPWVFVVVRDATLRAELGSLVRRAWDAHGRAYSEARLPPALLEEVDQGARRGIAAAPVVVVACGDTGACHPAALPASIWPAVQNLLLAAGALGLGSALTTLGTTDPETRQLLGLPDSVQPMAVIPIGYPAHPLAPPRRAPLATRVHRERYGAGW